jgi:hypothetical protein
MHRIIRTKAYEAKHGPHFDEEHARKAVSKMENEDGSRGQHWSVEETSALANQYGIRFDSKFNKYDWYVALNMVYSDYYCLFIIQKFSKLLRMELLLVILMQTAE